MATGPGVNQGKTAFVEEYLAGNRDADHPAVNVAWKAAGNEGTVSESLVSKARSRLKLTGKREAKGGADAGPAAKAKSSLKKAKGNSAPKVEETPSRPNRRESGSGPSKSAFVEEVFGREPRANVAAINRSWSAAGNDGSISDSIVYKVKRDLGLTGGGSGRHGASEAATEPGSAAVESGDSPSLPNSRETIAPIPSGTVTASVGVRERLVDEVEAGIDELIYVLKSGGGMPEVEAALRAARRLLTRS